MTITAEGTVQAHVERQGPRLDLRNLPDRIDDVTGGSLIGRHWCQAQLYWTEYLAIRRRLAAGHRLTGTERARLWQLIERDGDGGGEHDGDIDRDEGAADAG